MTAVQLIATAEQTSPRDRARDALRSAADEVIGVPCPMRRLLARIGHESPQLWGSYGLAGHYALHHKTLESRVARAGLPTLRNYIMAARLMHAAADWEDPSVPLWQVQANCYAGSTLALRRIVRRYLGVTTTEAREKYPLAMMKNWYKSKLLIPYAAQLRAAKVLPPMDLYRDEDDEL